ALCGGIASEAWAGLVVHVEAPSAAIRGQTTTIRFVVIDDDTGERFTDPVRFALRASAPGRFTDVAERGQLIEGGGTSEIVVETDAGIVEVGLMTPTPGAIELDVIDVDDDDAVDIRIFRLPLVHDFEDGDEGYVVESDHAYFWQLGT